MRKPMQEKEVVVTVARQVPQLTATRRDVLNLIHALPGSKRLILSSPLKFIPHDGEA